MLGSQPWIMRMGVPGRPSILVVSTDQHAFNAIANELVTDASYVCVCLPGYAASVMSAITFSFVTHLDGSKHTHTLEPDVKRTVQRADSEL